MIFSNEKISEILRIIDFNNTLFIGKNVGTDILTNEDIRLLKQFGVDIDDLKVKFTPYEQQFYFQQVCHNQKHELAALFPSLQN